MSSACGTRTGTLHPGPLQTALQPATDEEALSVAHGTGAAVGVGLGRDCVVDGDSTWLEHCRRQR